MTTTTQGVLTFDAENFEQEVLKSDQPVLVDFWADWCPPCKAIAPIIDQVASEFEGAAQVGKVDVDRNTALAEQYDIRSIPTLLFFKDGKVVDRVQGIVSKDELARRLAALSESL